MIRYLLKKYLKFIKSLNCALIAHVYPYVSKTVIELYSNTCTTPCSRNKNSSEILIRSSGKKLCAEAGGVNSQRA